MLGRVDSRSGEAQAGELELYKTLAQLEELEAEIRGRHARYGALSQPRTLSASEIQGLLDPDTVLLEYALGEERSYLWAVTSTSIRSFELPARREIEAAAREAYRELSTLDVRDQRRQRAAALSRLVLGPVAEYLLGQRLAVVADGVLNYISFGALPLPSDDDMDSTEDPLLLFHELVYLPSASALAAQRDDQAEQPVPSMRVAVLADPVFGRLDPRVRIAGGGSEDSTSASNDLLERSAREVGVTTIARLPETRREAGAILDLVPPELALAALDFLASRETLLSPELRDYQIVHLATHGLVNSETPELSGLVLSLVDADGVARPGFVRLHDISELKLGAELVVLSACQTALGREIQGEGLVGLSRGFMYAGVPRVVASFWRVHDRATAELMARFYRGMWEEGLEPAAALREAQLSVLRERGWGRSLLLGGLCSSRRLELRRHGLQFRDWQGPPVVWVG